MEIYIDAERTEQMKENATLSPDHEEHYSGEERKR